MQPGLRIRSIFGQIRILLALAKNQFKHTPYIFFIPNHQISTDIFMLTFLTGKIDKCIWKYEKAQFFFWFCPSLYNFA